MLSHPKVVRYLVHCGIVALHGCGYVERRGRGRSPIAKIAAFAYALAVQSGEGSLRGLVAVLVSVVVSGCTPYGSEYDAVAYYLRGGSAARSAVEQKCIERRSSQKSRQEIAAELNIPEKRVPTVVCGRIINGIASGRVTRDDYVALYGQDKVTPNMQAVLLGQ